MNDRPSGPLVRGAVACGAALVILTLLALQVHLALDSADRRLGVLFASAERVVIAGVTPGGPAAQAGLRDGDRLVQIATRPIDSADDFDLAAEAFVRGEPIALRVVRSDPAQGDRALELTVVPGMPVGWLGLSINAIVVVISLVLCLLAVLQRGDDVRARLIAWFSFLLALELALPRPGTSPLALDVLASSGFYLATGAQLSIVLHLAAVLPERRPFLRRLPWLVPIAYVIGLGTALLVTCTYWIEVVGGQSRLPWSLVEAEAPLFDILFNAVAVIVPALLLPSAVRHPDLASRHQAGLIFLGILPWTIYTLAGSAADLVGADLPQWTDELFSLIPLSLPIAVFVAIFRYQLFDIELVVRRSVLYTLLTTLLVAVFYGVAGLLGALVARGVDDARRSMWVVAGAMFFAGLAFGTLRRWLQQLIDHRLYPERQALRRHLVELASELPALGTVAAMGDHLVERLRSIFAVSSATLLLAEAEHGVLLSIAASPSESPDGSSLSFLVPPDDPGVERLRRTGRPLPMATLLDDSSSLAQRFAQRDAALAVPLMAHDRMIGLLVLGSPEPRRRFAREEIELLSLVGHQAATAFENVRLFESATFEGLTGLRRREAILEHLDREIERALRYGRPLVVGMADLDYFKSINDRFGHLAGDAVLKRVADELVAGLRSSDAVGRYGGEEFLLVLPETDADGGWRVADKLRQRIAHLTLPMPNDRTVEPRISIGLAAMGAGAETPDREHLVEAADRALYRAKQLGRDRVELAGGDDASDQVTDLPDLA